MQLKDNCLRIIESLNNDELKLGKEKKDDIISNVNEIYTWLCESKYEDIDMEKYKELMHDFKANYSLLMITPKTGNIDTFNAEGREGGGGVEILDDDVNNKKYGEHIIFIRDLIEEYDLYNKHNNELYNKHNNDNNDLFRKVYDLFRKVYDLANELLIKFFIESNISNDEVINSINTIKTFSEEFKSEYCKLNIELNILDRVIYKHKQIEDKYLLLLDTADTTDINLILDTLIDYDTIIYKMKNNYDVYDEDKLILIEKELDKL